MFLGGVDPNTEKNAYVGYLQNLYLNDVDALEKLRGSSIIVDSFQRLPPLIYSPVTFPKIDTFIELPPLRLPPITVLHFMFKTKVPKKCSLLFNFFIYISMSLQS